MQRYLEGRMLGPCDMCEGAQFVYEATGKPVPASVRVQIATANDLIERVGAFGAFTRNVPLWPRSSTVETEQLVPFGPCYEITSEWPARPVVKESA